MAETGDTLVHKRSIQKRRQRSRYARERREASRYVSLTSFRDLVRAENISVITPDQIVANLITKFGEYPLIDVDGQYPKGLVISDSRGEGTQQRVE